jgi:hypothetical protein
MGILGVLYPGLKRREREEDHSPPVSPHAKNETPLSIQGHEVA